MVVCRTNGTLRTSATPPIGAAYGLALNQIFELFGPFFPRRSLDMDPLAARPERKAAQGPQADTDFDEAATAGVTVRERKRANRSERLNAFMAISHERDAGQAKTSLPLINQRFRGALLVLSCSGAHATP